MINRCSVSSCSALRFSCCCCSTSDGGDGGTSCAPRAASLQSILVDWERREKGERRNVGKTAKVATHSLPPYTATWSERGMRTAQAKALDAVRVWLKLQRESDGEGPGTILSFSCTKARSATSLHRAGEWRRPHRHSPRLIKPHLPAQSSCQPGRIMRLTQVHCDT